MGSITQFVRLSNNKIKMVPEGADPDEFRAFEEALLKVKAAKKSKPKKARPAKKRKPSRRPAGRSSKHRADSVLFQSTATLVDRKNGKDDDPADDGEPSVTAYFVNNEVRTW